MRDSPQPNEDPDFNAVLFSFISRQKKKNYLKPTFKLEDVFLVRFYFCAFYLLAKNNKQVECFCILPDDVI